MHVGYLLELRTAGAKVFEKHRAAILRDLLNQITFMALSKTLSWHTRQCFKDYISDVFSYENLLGFKQLSIFDDLTDEQVNPQGEEVEVNSTTELNSIT